MGNDMETSTHNSAHNRSDTLFILGPSFLFVWMVVLAPALASPWKSDANSAYWLLGANFAGIVTSELGMALRLKTTLVDVLIQGRLNPWLLAGVMALTVWPVGQIERLGSISIALLWVGLFAPTIAYALILESARRSQGEVNRRVALMFGVATVVTTGGFAVLSMWSLAHSDITDRFVAGRGGFESLVGEYKETGGNRRWETQKWNWWWMPLDTARYSPGAGGADEVLMTMLEVESVSYDTSIVNSSKGAGAILLEIRRFRGVETTSTTNLVYSEAPLRNELLSQGNANDSLANPRVGREYSCVEIDSPWYSCTR